MAKLKGNKVILKRGDGAATEVFTKIANVRSFSAPNFSRDVIDVTDFDSPDDWREKLSTLKDGGTITFPIFWDPSEATHETLKSDFEDGNNHNYQLVFPDSGATTLTLPSIVTGFAATGELGGALTANLTLTVSAKPTWA